MKKNEKEKSFETKLRSQLIVSLLCTILCAAALASSAYAWFTMSVESNVPSLNASEYALEIKDDAGDKVKSVYTFSENCQKTFILTAENSENNSSTGYCRITIKGKAYYTKQIKKGDSLNLKITADAGTAVEFTPCWGTSAYYTTDDPVLYGGDIAINAADGSANIEPPAENEPSEPAEPPAENEPAEPAEPPAENEPVEPPAGNEPSKPEPPAENPPDGTAQNDDNSDTEIP